MSEPGQQWQAAYNSSRLRLEQATHSTLPCTSQSVRSGAACCQVAGLSSQLEDVSAALDAVQVGAGAAVTVVRGCS